MTRMGKQQSLKNLHRNNFIRLNDMLLLDIVYLDHQLCVVNTNSNNNSDLNDSVLSYFKRTRNGFEKIFDLNVPESVSSSCSSESSFEESDEDWIEVPTVLNWADEVLETDPLNLEVPEWAKIPGLDYKVDEVKTSSTEIKLQLNYNHNNIVDISADGDHLSQHSLKDFTFNWADEEVSIEDLKSVQIPEWARIPGFDFKVEADDKIVDSSPEKGSWADDTTELGGVEVAGFIFNWADEEVSLEDIKRAEVPEWAKIPGFDLNVEADDKSIKSSPIHGSSADNTTEKDRDVGVRDFNWADEDVSLEDIRSVEVPEWAKIPGFDFKIELDGLTTIWE